MSLTRNDRIWLVRILIIGSLLLTLVNVVVFGVQLWNQHRERSSTEETTVMTGNEAAPEEQVLVQRKTDIEGRIRYPIFRGDWRAPSLRKINRGI